MFPTTALSSLMANLSIMLHNYITLRNLTAECQNSRPCKRTATVNMLKKPLRSTRTICVLHIRIRLSSPRRLLTNTPLRVHLTIFWFASHDHTRYLVGACSEPAYVWPRWYRPTSMMAGTGNLGYSIPVWKGFI